MKTFQVFTTLACLVLAAVAQAHSHLKEATPADGSVVTTVPPNVVLKFSAPAKVATLSLQKHGEAEQKLAPLPAAAAAEITVPLPKLAPGTYAILWRVVGEDGHIMGGKVTFTFDPQGTPSVGKPAGHDH